MDLTTCPACGAAAEVLWRVALCSSGGPVEHLKILCVCRRWFLLPAAALTHPVPGALGAS